MSEPVKVESLKNGGELWAGESFEDLSVRNHRTTFKSEPVLL